jgi:hypothetical protein
VLWKQQTSPTAQVPGVHGTVPAPALPEDVVVLALVVVVVELPPMPPPPLDVVLVVAAPPMPPKPPMPPPEVVDVASALEVELVLFFGLKPNSG